MKKFNYTLNHKLDEAYMAKMCGAGWAATRLVEGVWTFEPCRPNQYVYRVCYLRGKRGAEVEDLKRKLAGQAWSSSPAIPSGRFSAVPMIFNSTRPMRKSPSASGFAAP